MRAGAAPDIDDLAALRLGFRCGSGNGRRHGLGRRGAGHLLTEPTLFRGPDRLWLGLLARDVFASVLARGGAVVEGQDDLPDLHPLALFDLHFPHGAAHRRGHLNRRFVGLELEHRLIFRHAVAGRYEHAHDVAAGDVLAEFWKGEIGRHCPLL